MVGRPFPHPWSVSCAASLVLFVSASLALMASAGLAFAKDSVTIGMVLEPPGLDPTSAPAAAIGEVTHYNIFEGLTKINEDFSVTPLLAENWDLLARSQDADLHAEAERQVPGRRAVLLEGRQVLVRALRRKDSTNKDKAFFASIESIETPDPNDRRAQFQGAELRGAVSSRQ